VIDVEKKKEYISIFQTVCSWIMIRNK
jgi:hypothetical protein